MTFSFFFSDRTLQDLYAVHYQSTFLKLDTHLRLDDDQRQPFFRVKCIECGSFGTLSIVDDLARFYSRAWHGRCCGLMAYFIK